MSTILTSKYIKIIQTFTNEELKSFELWLRSPWANSNKNLIKLLDKIKKYYPEFSSPKLTKEKLFYQILPNGKFSDRRMNNILSEGYLAAEKFIIFQNLSKDENLQKNLLTKEFQYRHLEDWFFKDINKEISRLENTKIKEWEDHLNLFQLRRRVYLHPNQNPKMQLGGELIFKMNEELDLIYLLEKAYIINEKIFRNRVYKNENHPTNSDLEKWTSATKGVENLSVDFYKFRFDYHKNNTPEKYYNLRKSFLEHHYELSNKQKKVHLVSLLNDTTKLVRASHFDITELLPLYKLGLETEVIMSDGLISHNTYRTIVNVSNADRDFTFTKYFIESYTQKLDKKYQLDALYWANAHTAYRQEKYSESLDILLSYDFKIHYFQLMTKSLTLQVYFDLLLEDHSYQDFLFNYFDSFEKWLHREKRNSNTLKKGFLKFIQKSRALAKYYSDVNFKPKKVIELLKDEPNVQASKWLRQKIEKVLKKRGH